ncbi:MCE family protein [Saccharopolyspora dendranthemae]|uniref:Phospholipid/cholesterol/gamma-HCH transport system substrate-binding protein n=1 Tax=Saccharopolyspora dendranthemae TaxID=1181886 RepID=A0A561V8Z7_9PSEU|nr:MCE family protein [Saccharopolyspora dendranthemae]TWG08070.1 phospholipid/cholesterol/gamma-HCH transport system substrate-binding protein [Saccharopolyspora dendranthemae]
MTDSKLGVIGTALLAVLVLFSLSGDAISPLLAGRSLHAVFAEAGGLVEGDPVVVSGMTVGRVEEVALRDTDVLISFHVDEPGLRIGEASTAAVKAQSALGEKALSLGPAGPGELPDDAHIPLSRTVPPYDVAQALQGLTDNTARLDTARLTTAIDTVADTLEGTARSVPGALTGLRRLAESVNARDTELRSLLEHSRATTQVLAQHDSDLRAVFEEGTTLLLALNERQAAIEQLLADLTRTADELDALARENDAQLRPALTELQSVLTILRENRDNVTAAVHEAVPMLRTLGEVLSTMPALDAYFANIPPTNAVPGLEQLLGRGTR